jgi:prophage endopeptidase
MDRPMTPETIKIAIVAAIAALLFAAGWQVNGWRKDAEIDRIERAHAEQRAHDAEVASAEIAAAVARGDQLAGRVAAAETAREIAHQEKTDALRKVTTGRPCLGGAAVRLLNQSPGIRAVPGTASQPVLVDAAFATDTDVAQWAALAIRYYDTCRGRLDAIGEFFNGEAAQ